MGILEEIKKAEKTAEDLKINAEKEGIALVQRTTDECQKRLEELLRENERQRQGELLNLKDYINERIKEIQKEYEERIINFKKLALKNRESALIRAMEIILKWPSSASRK
ncbi:MAG: hypothetical protein ABIL70_06895 [candidate division WOR-3 bacterium]